jgi:hypothetical protein
MNERCIYARVSHPVVNLNSQYQRTNQITNLFLSFPHPLPLASVCSYPPSPFYFLSLFKWRVSAYKPRIPSLTHDPRLLTYHVFSVDPLAMSQKPNAIIFGGLNTCSRSLAGFLVPLEGESLVSNLRIIDKYSVVPPTTCELPY